MKQADYIKTTEGGKENEKELFSSIQTAPAAGAET